MTVEAPAQALPHVHIVPSVLVTFYCSYSRRVQPNDLILSGSWKDYL